MLYVDQSNALNSWPMHLQDYLSGSRGRATAIAKLAGFSPAFLQQIASGKRRCPADRATRLEWACAHEVRRWDLRDDWHEIWPELIGSEGAPPVPTLATEESDAA